MPRLTTDGANISAVFDRYLNGRADQPVGVAVSGGGDSVALLYLLAEWSQRPLHVFCVDHGLNPLSSEWTDSVARHAAAIGAGFTALHWRGDKPATGLSAAARAARHALLAEAARQKGVRVLCMAHTGDDVTEASLMRSEGSTVGAPRMWSPSPAWPQGRGVFLLRPLLDRRREDLRDYLRQHGVGWIDDPANVSDASLRARARKTLQGKVFPSVPSDETIDLTGLLRDAGTLGALGQIVFAAANFAARPRPQALRLLAMAAVSAGGGQRLPRQDRLDALYGRLPSGQPSTLSGARIQQAGDRIVIGREAGDIGRHADGSLAVQAGVEAIWDGRFAVTSSEPGVIRAGKGLRTGLSDAEKAWLATLPASLRDTLPVVEDGPKLRRLPDLVSLRSSLSGKAFARCWVLPRFLAACGAFATERDLQGLYSGGPNGL